MKKNVKMNYKNAQYSRFLLQLSDSRVLAVKKSGNFQESEKG